MPGVEDPKTIDLVTHDPKTDEYTLIMVELAEHWENTEEQLDQLLEKINNYARVRHRRRTDPYLSPEAAGKPLRVQLDCLEPPTGKVGEASKPLVPA